MIMSQDFQAPGYHCSVPGCKKVYTRNFRLNEHQRVEHGIQNQQKCTRNFECPFCCKSESQPSVFRTNTELLKHCEKLHDDWLGEFNL